jgi:hypothetical protein
MNKKTIGLAMFIALGAALATGLGATPSVYATTVYQEESDGSVGFYDRETGEPTGNAHDTPFGGVTCEKTDKRPGMTLDQICIHVAP